MHILQNAVHPMEELQQVKNQADQLQACHGKTIKYEPYCNLLLLAASNYDYQYAPKGRSDCTNVKQSWKNIYVHDLVDYGDYDANDIYNLDSDVVDLQANVHKQHTKAPAFASNRTAKALLDQSAVA